jgi:hypothetical protein
MAVMPEKTIAQLKAEYEKTLRDAFTEELSSPEKIKEQVRKTVNDGIGALMGLRRDTFRDHWEPGYNQSARPFLSLAEDAVREVMIEARPQIMEFVKEVVLSKTFQKEVKDRYKGMLHRCIEKTLENKAMMDAEKHVLSILSSVE